MKGAINTQNPDDEMYGKVDLLGVIASDNITLVEIENSVPNCTELLANPVFYPQNEKF
ncbi:hypothetical protein [Psychrobacillus sp. NPDC096389]|uniref:hypothetical protein n=1 Tax=Psychrobacillus sp. NPDC096389 TaxID=3364490 RepID=UPI0038142FB3